MLEFTEVLTINFTAIFIVFIIKPRAQLIPQAGVCFVVDSITADVLVATQPP